MKRFLLWLALAAVVMLALPWLTVTFVKGSSGMAVCFLLFFAVNPVFSLILGIFAGANGRALWSLPILSPLLFLVAVWIFFAPGETAFYLYAAAYLVLGLAAAAVSAWLRKRSAHG